MNHNTNIILVLLDMLTVAMLIIPSCWEGMWTKATFSRFKLLYQLLSFGIVLGSDIHCPVLVWLPQEDIHTLLLTFLLTI